MIFKHLMIGDTFQFAQVDGTIDNQLPGPWVKISAKKCALVSNLEEERIVEVYAQVVLMEKNPEAVRRDWKQFMKKHSWVSVVCKC